ncbi:hypothetical protein EV194_10418 [Natronoflexus pectinivorans]|uniref:Uncharacterized protein n=1 Tax=Natronoflexus pectinivorans TaxID=682526 RepID=A0A4R2GJI2_9BACT|nr:hypothetical protein EV194_10418 [Natronoflexus pectinivorans]
MVGFLFELLFLGFRLFMADSETVRRTPYGLRLNN